MGDVQSREGANLGMYPLREVPIGECTQLIEILFFI